MCVSNVLNLDNVNTNPLEAQSRNNVAICTAQRRVRKRETGKLYHTYTVHTHTLGKTDIASAN